MRLRSIAFALFYGLAPSSVYEAKCHYACSYLEHLVLNLRLAGRWLTFRETFEDVEFEREVNAPRRRRRRSRSWAVDTPLHLRAWYCLTGRQW
jgi:hypothetical protein